MAVDNKETVPLLILDLGLDIVNGIGGLHLEGDGLSCEGLYEDLHDDVYERVRWMMKGEKKERCGICSLGGVVNDSVGRTFWHIPRL